MVSGVRYIVNQGYEILLYSQRRNIKCFGVEIVDVADVLGMEDAAAAAARLDGNFPGLF